MSVRENTDLVRRYFDTIWNKGQFEREPEFVALDIVVHAPPIPGIPDGIAGPLTIVGTFRGAMPDLHLTQDLVFGAEDKVVQIWTTRGFHTGGDLFGFPASGKEMVLTGINIFRVENGRIAERWGTMDLMGLMQQLGVAPATSEDLLDLRKGWYM
ncbi:MAG TPA: ester cyclase [Anaerolineae bacterium]|nr:ester cyclase [Anaerolineae bacterium]